MEVGNEVNILFSTITGIIFIIEVRIVRTMPRLTANEQPTIAIITSLYCEKLAVDALIDEKTTFVKYKTEGKYFSVVKRKYRPISLYKIVVICCFLLLILT